MPDGCGEEKCIEITLGKWFDVVTIMFVDIFVLLQYDQMNLD